MSILAHCYGAAAGAFHRSFSELSAQLLARVFSDDVILAKLGLWKSRLRGPLG
ncbi:hypothetical protein Pan181_45730 [Aeoliella mucimassa]|uniref:Uncharacterized protein n=1 Tax=Aeoliella mucimassa TaxID=2527972 RepID=A0A518AUD6_9BACT|nr:hypothetical protein Pan181_45730 [Aeoliella mucimassa]